MIGVRRIPLMGCGSIIEYLRGMRVVSRLCVNIVIIYPLGGGKIGR